MKIRSDFVTNSSSSSFICCFARIADPTKAASTLEKHSGKIELYTGTEVLAEMSHSRWSAWLEYDWACVDVTPRKEYIEKHINDNFIVISDSFDIEEPWDGEPNYDICYSDFDKATKAAIDSITEENGFADSDCQYGAGRNG